jgi:monoamine oxidase
MAHSPLYRALARALTVARAANLRATGAGPTVTRRQVLRGAAASGALAVAGCLPGPQLNDTPRIAIVGGGLAGLAAAWHLQNSRFAARVYEAASRVGGRTATGELNGLALNLGGEFIDSDHADLLGIAKELEVPLFDRRGETTDESVPAIAFYFDGRAIPESELSDALRPFAVAIGSDADRLDKDKANIQPALDRLSVADYLARHAALLAQPYLQLLIVAAIRSEFGVEPADASVLQLIGLLPTVDGQRVDLLGATDEAFVVKGGSAKIAEALAARLGNRVQTGRRLESIAPAGEGYRLAFAGGATVEADFVILAMPHPPLRRVNFAMGLPPLLRRFIAETGPGTNEKIIQTFRRRAWRTPAGFSKEAWTSLGFSEAWDSSAALPDRPDGALTFFYGGRETAAMDPALGLAALDRVIPGLAAEAAGRILRTQWSADALCGGAYTNLKPGQQTEFAQLFWSEEREVSAGRIYFAGEQTSERYYGYMNGAVESGRYAAEAVVRHITGV